MNIEINTCFVIQPFDNDKFDKRYDDTFEPAIRAADLKPYRVDKDPSVRIPIEEIEKQIKASSICFADITLDNPNVWYELGYAFACGKDVIMVCSDERVTKYPFDIQHKTVISYKTGSPSYFATLETQITEKLKALRQSRLEDRSAFSNRIINSTLTIALDDYEVTILKLVLEGQPTYTDHARLHEVNSSFSKAGYTDYRFSLALRGLTKKGFIETSKESDDWNNFEYIACRVTDVGEEWVFSNLENDHRLKDTSKVVTDEDDLPF